MSHYPSTSREVDDLLAYLAPVAAERRPAIARMVFEQIGICPVCDRAVRRCDARVLRG